MFLEVTEKDQGHEIGNKVIRTATWNIRSMQVLKNVYTYIYVLLLVLAEGNHLFVNS